MDSRFRGNDVKRKSRRHWIPAFAGMTSKRSGRRGVRHRVATARNGVVTARSDVAKTRSGTAAARSDVATTRSRTAAARSAASVARATSNDSVMSASGHVSEMQKGARQLSRMRS
jgi:hypothetical protein